MGAEFTAEDMAKHRQIHGYPPLEFRVAHASLSPKARSSPLAFFVHPNNPLRRITLDQARRIFTRSANEAGILKWRQLGLDSPWTDRPIHPVGLGDRTALGQFILRHKFASGRFTGSYTGLGQSREVVDLVASDTSAIGFANLSHANDTVKVVPIANSDRGPVFAGTEAEIRSGTYPLDRYLLVYVTQKLDGSIDPIAREWLNLIFSCEGQQLIGSGSLGYLPLSFRELQRERKRIPPSP
jgi:phosphate transport system substrate-binding protein